MVQKQAIKGLDVPNIPLNKIWTVILNVNNFTHVKFIIFDPNDVAQPKRREDEDQDFYDSHCAARAHNVLVTQLTEWAAQNGYRFIKAEPFIMMDARPHSTEVPKSETQVKEKLSK